MAPCDWTLNTSCCTGWDDYTTEVQETATAWATGILDALTGRQFAQCPVVVRPCGKRCGWSGGYLTFPVNGSVAGSAGAPGWMTPYTSGGVWRNCACGGPCSCRARCEAHLNGPVAEVVEVKVDGVVIDPAAYRLDDGSILVRTDGECWPECQDLNLSDDEPDTFSVQYRPGAPLPPIGQIAAGELACQFAKACSSDASCALPQQLQSLSRNGVQVEVVDPNLLTENGLTGLPNVDLFIKAVNPQRLARRPRVLSPDFHGPRRTS